MDVRRLDRTTLKHENGLDAQRLLPWPALNAPFEGSWCVIAPGTASTPHAHHEHEIFIAVAGGAVLESEGEQADFRAGDVVYFPPGVEHRVVNKAETAFEMYSVWWAVQMSHRFAVRHHGEG